MIDLGTLGGTYSQGFGLNNNGSVVGIASTANDTSFHAFLWQKGKMIDLGTLAGSDTLPFSLAVGINERDEVAGYSETSGPDPLGENFCGDSLICLPFIWQDGVMTPLPTLGGNNGQATGINNRGQVVGYAENSTPDPSCQGSNPQVLHFEPVIWNKGKVQELPTFLGDLDGLAAAINGEGDAVGVSFDCQFVPGHALLWRPGTLTDLGTLGGLPLMPADINNEGQVVGVAFMLNGPNVETFLWHHGVVRGLGSLPGDASSSGNAINDRGQLVGQSCTDQNCVTARAFLWEDGVMTDLNTLVPADSPLQMVDSSAINSRGEIVGVAVKKSTGELRAFLATPCDREDSEENTCEDSAESATAAKRTALVIQSPATVAPEKISESPQVVLPEKVRKLLQQRRGFGRLLGPAIRPSTD